MLACLLWLQSAAACSSFGIPAAAMALNMQRTDVAFALPLVAIGVQAKYHVVHVIMS